ncbi:AbrB/MazE/SpoVT family DNA-binding domain-containing protein [Neobacillus sp. SM06]|uniref:AbrB/MazE/SpoVT family DNA-binding domain-containing protein n=1 Tax=Neobacillus sp. SM06 TaxID=3422492 RepID=UPI003D2C3C56
MEAKKKRNEKEVERMPIATTIQKWGNSLAVRIPKEIAERVRMQQGSEIEIRVSANDEAITLTPKKQQKKYSLDELLAKCKPEYRHKEIDLGTEGNELI